MSPKPVSGGLLSVVATPIGNLEDITLRALRTLREADMILAEDTRRTRGLLTHHGVPTALRSLHAHSSSAAIDTCVAQLLLGRHLALVTDAGTPLVSDPGAPLVRAASAAGVVVQAIPGPSALTAALTVAAIPCDGFRFFGFLPRTGSARRAVLDRIARSETASVVFESPQRLARTLADLRDAAGPDRQAAVCRELTKLHEEVARDSLDALATRFATGTRGEITLVIAADHRQPERSYPDARAHAATLLSTGLSPRDAARQLALDTGLGKRDAYALIQELQAAGE